MSKFCTIGNCHCDDNGMARRVAALERSNKELRESVGRCLRNAYDHIQHEAYNDALSSIMEAQAALSAADAKGEQNG